VHQDQYYLRVKPGTCIAAWMALDPCDRENGCLEVLPGSHEWPILCTVGADTSESFTDITVPLPDDAELVPVLMDPGDVLFFNGSLVHGSNPNRSARFRRSHGPCGEWVDRDGRPVIELTGVGVDPRTTE
jgi:phytanoyl-CoA hydroxylase